MNHHFTIDISPHLLFNYLPNVDIITDQVLEIHQLGANVLKATNDVQHYVQPRCNHRCYGYVNLHRGV